jgi:hypothetical protein
MSEKWINWLKSDIARKKKPGDDYKSFRRKLKSNFEFPINLISMEDFYEQDLKKFVDGFIGLVRGIGPLGWREPGRERGKPLSRLYRSQADPENSGSRAFQCERS